MAKNKLTHTEKLFRRASRYNWDDGYSSLKKMINSEYCDKGTALMIYWKSRPEWFRQYSEDSEVPSYQKENYLFIKFVEQQFMNINKEEIIYDPFEDNEVGLYDNDITYKMELPEIMYKKTNGTIHYKEVLKK